MNKLFTLLLPALFSLSLLGIIHPNLALAVSPSGLAIPNISSSSDTIRVCLGEPLNLSASGSTWTPGSTPLFSWSFGDGTTATTIDLTTTHLYNAPGGYVVSLSVSDSNGCTSEVADEVIVFVSTPFTFDLATSTSTLCLGNSMLMGSPINIDPSSPQFGIAGPNGYSQSWVESNTTVFENALQIPDNECVQATILLDDFGTETIDEPSDINNIHFNMEHSFVGDIVINVICPTGNSLNIFPESGGTGIFVGQPIDDVSGTPGTGFDYSFSPGSTGGTWVDYTAGGGASPLQSGNYEAEGSFSDLIGCPLNGTWTLEICDLAGADDGFIFSFGIDFDASFYTSVLSFTPSIGGGCDSSYWETSDLLTEVGSDCDVVSFTPIDAGNYAFEYTVMNDFGCVFTEVIEVTVIPNPIVSVADVETCNDGQELIAVVENATPGTPYAYSWSPSTGLNSPIISSPDIINLQETTTYTVIVTRIGLENCVGTAQATATLIEGGCTDATACNYDPTMSCNDGSCTFPGCDDMQACNYNPAAGCSDGSCFYTNAQISASAIADVNALIEYSLPCDAGCTYLWTLEGSDLGSIQGPSDSCVLAVLWSPNVGQANIGLEVNCASGCQATYNLPVNVVNGIDELAGAHFSVFPNPFQDYVTIASPFESQKTTVQVYSAMGELVFSGDISKTLELIQTTSWARGLYTIQLASEGIRTNFRMIKK